ncbi:sugar transporter ERD6-like 16 [Chenopodium quinoa]|uniref:Major facilitator superfamily (MFS) profile domain-containing protein n=1 Tax=Chenopodium quinoa TaxID=63459 RepID=A0A803MSP1_CHEQI|nr:sugar transporter ERD6-like 16 [Chenopodium quinoa]
MTIEHDEEIGAREAMQDVKEPLIEHRKINGHENKSYSQGNGDKGSNLVVFISTMVAVMGSFEFGSCVGYTAPTQTSIIKDLNLSVAEFSLFGSILSIGAVLGATTSGRIADHFGRKGALAMSTVSCIIGWVAIYFSREAMSLDIGRFLTGYGIGVSSYVVPIYIGEIAPKNLRGGLGTLNQLMIVIGASTACFVGTIVTWRVLALTGIIPCIILLVGLIYIPESPRWLAKAGQMKRFESALRMLRGKDADISTEAYEIQEYIETIEHLPKVRMLDLFQQRYKRSVTIGVGLMLLQQLGGANGMGFYASEMFVAAGFPSGKFGIIMYASIQIPITAIGAMLMDRSGRKPLLLVSSAGTFFGCFLVGSAFLAKRFGFFVTEAPYLVLGGALLYIGSFSIGAGAIPWVMMAEIFPINVKGVAGGLVNLVHWFCAWAVSYTFNFFFNYSAAGTFYFYAAACALNVLFVAKLVPETKGKTLEDIQVTINQIK